LRHLPAGKFLRRCLAGEKTTEPVSRTFERGLPGTPLPLHGFTCRFFEAVPRHAARVQMKRIHPNMKASFHSSPGNLGRTFLFLSLMGQRSRAVAVRLPADRTGGWVLYSDSVLFGGKTAQHRKGSLWHIPRAFFGKLHANNKKKLHLLPDRIRGRGRGGAPYTSCTTA